MTTLRKNRLTKAAKLRSTSRKAAAGLHNFEANLMNQYERQRNETVSSEDDFKSVESLNKMKNV